MSYSYAYIKHESTGNASHLMHQLSAATNLNASGLANAMKVAPSTVTRILHGHVCPSYDDMIHYVYCLGFAIEGNELARLEHLRGYRSPKEIGDFVTAEFADGITTESLDMVLRYIPKAVNDWRELDEDDREKLIVQPSRVTDIRFQALIEGAIQYFCHSALWVRAPKWSNKTKLKELFVPRATVKDIGTKWYDRMYQRCAPEFLEKNVLFTYDEMKVL